ncbi:DsbA family oxidoreductase [Lactobacillus sp. PV034]|uniref:DsbA family oxidoreductase n=1 Tax=Lactobacillus sp. PV034 TaxID=2594495 RepID=UPI00223F6672|nr:DsbA family protein [Lactobacillus sp. PV034]
MKIIVWSDFTSPASYLAQVRLQNVIKALNLTDKVEYEARAYQINPNASDKAVETNAAKLSLKKDITLDKAQAYFKKWQEEGKKEGIDVEAGFAYNTNTLDAHRLVAWIQSVEANSTKTQALIDAIFKAEFAENKNISDHAVLLDIIKSLGFDLAAAKEVLSTSAYREEVIVQEASFRDLGNYQVPVIIINNKVLEGLQPKVAYAQALNPKADEFVNDFLIK